MSYVMYLSVHCLVPVLNVGVRLRTCEQGPKERHTEVNIYIYIYICPNLLEDGVKLYTNIPHKALWYV